MDTHRSDDFLRKRTRGGQGWRMRRSWYYMIADRDQTLRSKNGYSTMREGNGEEAVYGRRPSSSSNVRVSFLKSQINRYQPRKLRKGATPDVLDAPDNKVNPRPRCRTSVSNERTHVLAISDAIFRAYVCALALSGATRVAT